MRLNPETLPESAPPEGVIVRTLRAWRRTWRRRGIRRRWEAEGRPLPPPPAVKHDALRHLAKVHRLRVFVETGTYRGDTIEAVKDLFDRVYSIELNEEYYVAARKRFNTDAHIELIHGDSGQELARLKPKLTEPTLFWLDGHYSGGTTAKGATSTPIVEELHAVLTGEPLPHVIVIDDARLFGKDPAYPAYEDLEKLILSRKADTRIRLENDSIVVQLAQVRREA